jgi:hypothetical protein
VAIGSGEAVEARPIPWVVDERGRNGKSGGGSRVVEGRD